MGRAILDVEGLRRVVAVIVVARDLVHLLMQGSAKGHVHFLEAPAEAQDRHSCLYGLTNQRERRRVTRGIVQGAWLARRAVVVVGLDVRKATRKKDAVQTLQQ